MVQFFRLVMFCTFCCTPTLGAELSRVAIEGPEVDVGSGGQYDGGRNPGCQAHVAEACVKPQHGGKIVPGTGRAKITERSGRVGVQTGAADTPEEFCLVFFANTGACEIPVFIRGRAVATEEYEKPADAAQ